MKILTIILLTIVISGGLTLFFLLPRNAVAPQEQESTEAEGVAEEKAEDPMDHESAIAIGEAQAELLGYQNQIAAAKAELALIEEKLKAETDTYNDTQQSEKKIQNLAKLYGSMKPDSAATILCNLEESLTTKIMTKMDGRSSSKLMDAIVSANPDYAASISKLMAGKPLASGATGSKNGSQATVANN